MKSKFDVALFLRLHDSASADLDPALGSPKAFV